MQLVLGILVKNNTNPVMNVVVEAQMVDDGGSIISRPIVSSCTCGLPTSIEML